VNLDNGDQVVDVARVVGENGETGEEGGPGAEDNGETLMGEGTMEVEASAQALDDDTEPGEA
jgi:hypothetical protein